MAFGKVLAEIAQQQDKQLLLTTHSEHILASLLTLVAEDKLNPSDLCIHYLERRGDRATVERLDVDELGRVRGGLRGFFETGVSELRTYYEALDRERRDDET